MLKFDEKEAAFCKKRRKNFFESGPWALRIPTSLTQIQKSLFASRRASRFFFRKRSSCLLLIHLKPIMLQSRMTFDAIAARFHQMSESASKIFLEGDSDIKLNRERFNLMSSRSRLQRRIALGSFALRWGRAWLVGAQAADPERSLVS